MTKLSLFTQILMIVIAITIMFMYIKPTVTHIRTVQDATLQYGAEAEKVLTVNQLLATQVSKVDQIKQPDAAALMRYMPDSVDELEVMKDLVSILKAAGVSDPTVAYNGDASLLNTVGSDNSSLVDAEGVTSMKIYPFTISAQMTYQDMKRFLAALEINNYLMQIDTLKAAPGESGLLTVEMMLSTFARTPVTVSIEKTSSAETNTPLN